MSPLSSFHPVVQRWFAERLGEPTAPQREGWPLIREGRNVLIAAPTGSGKTLAAFLSAIDSLLQQGSALTDETQRPLRLAAAGALQRRPEEPPGAARRDPRAGPEPARGARPRAHRRHAGQRSARPWRKRPPHILVTTPESLYLLLTSDGGRRMLATVRTVIVDEIHALVRDKRGSHLALSLERLEALAGRPLQRIGLSATQKPLDEVGRFLVGAGRECALVDAGHLPRPRPRRRGSAVAARAPCARTSSGTRSTSAWPSWCATHRTTLVFVNTRKMAERIAAQLSKLLGDDAVASHHGSLSRERRLDAEERLKAGRLRAIVATASLELGIDIGDVDLVIQVGATRSIATFLQRVGRSGHALRKVPKGRLFPLTLDELVEAAALLRGVGRGVLDRTPAAPRRPRHPGPAGGGGLRARGVARRRPPGAGPPRVALPRPHARGARPGDRRSQPGPARAAPPRRRGRPPPGHQARAHGRAPLRRRDPRHRRLPGAPGAGRHARGHRARGLGDRVQRRRHLPAREHVLARAAGRDGSRARRRRQGPAAHACPSGSARRPAARASWPPRSRTLREEMADGSATSSCAPPAARRCPTRPRSSSPITSRPDARRWAPCPRSSAWCSSGSSTRAAACSSSCTRPSGRRSTAPGVWPCARSSASASASSSRPRPTKRPSSCRWARSTASSWPRCSTTCSRPPRARR